MRRRNFLKDAGLLLGGTSFLPAYAHETISYTHKLDTWQAVRQQFVLDQKYIHMALMLLASHPKMVRDEIEKHRRLFDLNPAEHWEDHFMTMEGQMSKAAAGYLNVAAEEVALTDSTSMGLGLLYTGFKLKPGEEVLTSTHDHYATEKSLEFAAAKNGASIRKIDLYTEPEHTSVSEIVEAVNKAIRPETRLLALTWVHSNTGVKLPIKEISKVVAEKNRQRAEKERMYFAVDGVHGLGIENIDLKDMGCDFFAAGTHKWMFGPRGTGILWARKDAWPMVVPTIPSFTGTPYGIWLGVLPDNPPSFADLCTAGGFHSFEHRWSLHKAFEFHQQIGKDKVQARTHELSSLLKQSLAENKRIRLRTPKDPSLSSGITCFEVERMAPAEVVKKFREKNILASSSPYRVSYVRLTPTILNTDGDIATCVKALEAM